VEQLNRKENNMDILEFIAIIEIAILIILTILGYLSVKELIKKIIKGE